MSFEHDSKEPDVLEPALQRHINDFGVGFSQELLGFLKPQLRPLGNQGTPEAVPESPAEVPNAATALKRQFFRGAVLQLGFRHLGKQFFKSSPGGKRSRRHLFAL